MDYGRWSSEPQVGVRILVCPSMIRTYAVCDECEESEILYDKMKDPDFSYEGILGEDGEPKFTEIEGWTLKAMADPDDPVVVTFKYYCPHCVAEDRIEDSGDTR